MSRPPVRSRAAQLHIVFRLQPYHVNFNKRIVKQPKLYFFDSGLVCALLGLQSPAQLGQHYLRGGIFESFVISELVKARWVAGLSGAGFFWRDRHGHEVDYLLETAEGPQPVTVSDSDSDSATVPACQGVARSGAESRSPATRPRPTTV